MNLWINTSHINSASFPTFCLLIYDSASFRARSVCMYVCGWIWPSLLLQSKVLKLQAFICLSTRTLLSVIGVVFRGLTKLPRARSSLRLRCHRARFCRCVRGLRVSYWLWRVGLHPTPSEMPCDKPTRLPFKYSISSTRYLPALARSHILGTYEKAWKSKCYLFVLRQLNFTLA